MMPDTRGRTSATRVGAIRPGSSRTTARALACTTTTLTSGSTGCTAAVAAVGSLHPASMGDRAASINAMQADCARKPDISEQSPLLNFDIRREGERRHAMHSRLMQRTYGPPTALQHLLRRLNVTRD